MKPPLPCAILLAGFLTFGCQTTPPLAAPETSTEVSGQLRVGGELEGLISDYRLEASSTLPDFELLLFKGTAFPLLEVRRTDAVVRFEATFEERSWQGAVDRAPGAVRPWATLGEVWQTALAHDLRPGHWTGKTWRADLTDEGGRPRLRIEFPESDLTFTFLIQEVRPL